MKIEVIKKDGSVQPFDQVKIAKVVEAAGLTPRQAETVAARVAQWANDWIKIKGQPQITTLEIRWKVIDELQDLNKRAADLYIWYKKTQDSDLKTSEK
jgi:transcriptional regulator NrdR family protein